MSEDTILREVDDELRGDRMRMLWRQFGPWLIAAAVVVVLAVAVNEGWRWWQTSTAARSSDQFYAALELAEAGDIAGAQGALNEVIASGSGNYPLLARFRQASLLARDGKATEAVAAYDALASTSTHQRIRELALVYAANLLVDSAAVGAVQQRVGGLATPDNPLRNAAREAIGLTQYKAGDLEAAMETFQAILVDPLASNDARSRVQLYLGQLTAEGAGAEQIVPVPAEAAPAPADTPALPGIPDSMMMAPAEAPAMAPAPVSETPAPPAQPAPDAPPAPASATPQPAPATPPSDPGPAEVPAATTPAPAADTPPPPPAPGG